MSPTSNITISLQTTSHARGPDPDKSSENRGLDNEMHDDGFDNALAKAQSNQSPTTGKELPREDAMREETAAAIERIKVDLNSLRVRKAGKLNLVTAPENSSVVSDESLITFMQEQGFSRADMAELLVAGHEGQSSDAQLTANWLKVRADNALGVKLQSMSESLSVDKIKTTDLAEALAKQLIEPRNSIKSSAILEVLAAKHIPQQLRTQLASESSDQMMIKLTDLLPSLAKKPLGGGSSNQGGPADSGPFSSNQLDANLSSELSKGPESREFREFLADHLKRAESLRELTDKLGTMVARQIAGQIGRGRWSLEIAMHPAELGSIEIEMQMTERGLEASFRASHSVTRDLLLESMPRLKSWFEEGGIDVAYTGLTQDSGAQNGGNPTGEQNAQSEIQVTESEESSDLTDNQLIIDGSTGLDIRV
ncbi:MAG: flagellar hook-length control protein FliK [Pseudomonadota bacterium]|nr:flagellar hook-length control protein FliK [Pseudomonadota bacterium]